MVIWKLKQSKINPFCYQSSPQYIFYPPPGYMVSMSNFRSNWPTSSAGVLPCACQLCGICDTRTVNTIRAFYIAHPVEVTTELPMTRKKAESMLPVLPLGSAAQLVCQSNGYSVPFFGGNNFCIHLKNSKSPAPPVPKRCTGLSGHSGDCWLG